MARFEPGQSGNPKGRPKGGRAIAIDTIDRIMREFGGLFEAHLRVQAKEDIGKFYKTYVYPLLPKDVNLNVQAVREILCLEVGDGQRRIYGESDALSSAQISIASDQQQEAIHCLDIGNPGGENDDRSMVVDRADTGESEI